MPTIVSPSMTRSAPMFFSAIRLSASNIDAVGPTVWTVGSVLDRRIWATLFIGASRDKRTLHIGGRATLSRCDVSHVLHAPSVLRVLLGRACAGLAVVTAARTPHSLALASVAPQEAA